MNQKSLLLILITGLILFGGVHAVSANNTTSFDPVSPSVYTGDTTEVSIIFDKVAPEGFAGCEFNITLSNTSVAKLIEDVTFPEWVIHHESVLYGDDDLFISASDADNKIKPGACDVPIVTFKVKGIETGTTDIAIENPNFDNMPDGNNINMTLNGATIAVTERVPDIVVDASGSCDYTTIQAAVDKANTGDWIIVKPGVYSESVEIFDSLNNLKITSETGAEETIVDAGGKTGFLVCDDGVEISGFTIKNSEPALYLRSADCTISGCNVTGNAQGLRLRGAENCRIYRNDFSGNTKNFVVSTAGKTNTWHSPEMVNYSYEVKDFCNYLGNYWGASGTDADGDGLLDDPFVIEDGFNEDNYTLAEPATAYGEELPDLPVAKFEANDCRGRAYGGRAPLTVPFTDLSTGVIDSYAWDFENDGTVDSTEQNPVWVYDTPGTYEINLTVTNAAGSDSYVWFNWIEVTKTTGPDIKSVHCYGGENTDRISEGCPTGDGGRIYAGESYSNDTYVTGHGSTDFWVVQTDASDNLEWQKCYGGSMSEEGHSICNTTDGGYIIVGRSESTDGDVTGNHGKYDAWVIKINATGDLQWQKCYGGSEWDSAEYVFQTSDDNFLIAVTTLSTDGDLADLPSIGRCDSWVIKIDSSGEILWQDRYGGVQQDYLKCGLENTDGEYVLCGYSRVDGFDKCWILDINSTGSLQWEKTYGGSNTDKAESIIQTSDGGYLLGGSTGSRNGDVTGHHGYYEDGWVVKTDHSGDLEWQKCYGGKKQDFLNAVIERPDGGYLLAGKTKSYDGDLEGYYNHYQGYTAWVMGIAPTGDLEWQKLIGARYDDIAYDVCIKENGDYLIAGVTYGSNGDMTDAAISGEDGFVAVLGHNVSLPAAEFEASPVSGRAPVQVQFKDLSSGDDISEWAWDFDSNGEIDSREQNPAYTYEAGGNFTVKLTVTNSTGSNTIAKEELVNLIAPFKLADVNFTSDVTTGNAPLAVQFNDTSVGNNIFAWNWEFGDGGSSEEQNPAYEYVRAGTYTVNLTVTDVNGTSLESYPDYITVTSADLTLSFDPVRSMVDNGDETTYALSLDTAPTGLSGCNLTVNLSDDAVGEITAVSLPDWASLSSNGSVPASSVWIKVCDNDEKIGRDAKDILLGSVTVKGLNSGKAMVSATVTKMGDDYGSALLPGAEGATFIVDPIPVPVADFEADVTSGIAPLTVNFTDLSTGAEEWAWDFDNDGEVNSTEQNTTHTYSAGTYTVNLTVTNRCGTDSVVKTDYITVDPHIWNVSDGESVQTAINNANDGDIVRVHAGTYTEALDINKKLTLEGIDNPVIKASSGNPVTISGAGSEMRGFTINQSAKWQFGVHITADGALFENNTLNDCNEGIHLDNARNAVIRMNVIKGCWGWVGLYEFSPGSTSSIYLNDFIQNYKGQTSQQGTSIWNSPEEMTYYFGGVGHTGLLGNYYDDYNGADVDKDGIGDTSCGKDNCPLMVPFAKYLEDEPVLPVLSAITVDPSTADLTPGSARSFNATGLDQDDKAMEGITFTWAVENESVGTVTEDGLFTADSEGKTNITASSGDVSGSALVTVTYMPVMPVADFEADVTSGTAPLTVSFTDLSTGAETWAWDFENDGVVDSEDQNTTHIYETAGTYSVRLSVTNADGSDDLVKESYITVSEGLPVLSAITVDPSTADLTAGETQSFTAVALDQNDRAMEDVTFTWAAENESVGTITEAGLFTAVSEGKTNITASSDDVSGSAEVTVTNAPVIPVADFEADFTSGDAPLTVHFTDNSVNADEWSWDLNGDDVPDSTEQNPVYMYENAGTYNVSLTAINGDGSNTTTKSDYIDVYEPLVADFAADHTAGDAPLEVHFTDLSTGAPTGWAWDFDGDEVTDSDEKAPAFIYNESGNYSVSLTITRGDDTDCAVKNKYIRVTSPTEFPYADFTADVTTGTAPLEVQFTDNSTGENISEWAWDFNGDKETDSTEQNPVYTYETAGTYTVNLTVTNDVGSNTATKARFITVDEPKVLPVADFDADITAGDAPLTVQFTDNSTDAEQWVWDFNGDDVTDSTEQNPAHTYSEAGNYTVSLTAINGDGTDTETKTDYIIVNCPAVETSIELFEGWNFVSTPKRLADGHNTAAVFADVDTDNHSIYTYDPENEWASMEETDPVKQLQGLWIYSTAHTYVNLEYDQTILQTPETSKLVKGWNAIGFSDIKPASAKATLFTVEGSWSSVLGYDAEHQIYETSILYGGIGSHSENRQMFPTKGYWMYMKADGTIAAIS